MYTYQILKKYCFALILKYYVKKRQLIFWYRNTITRYLLPTKLNIALPNNTFGYFDIS